MNHEPLSKMAMGVAARCLYIAILSPHNHVLDVPRAWLWAFRAITKYRRMDRRRLP